MLAALFAANSVLLAIAGFFMVRFVRAVDRLAERQGQMDRDFHTRIALLEKATGNQYNPYTGETHGISSKR